MRKKSIAVLFSLNCVIGSEIGVGFGGNQSDARVAERSLLDVGTNKEVVRMY